MDVTNEFQKVWIFFTGNGLVAVLKEVAYPFMASVEGDSVSGHETAHDLAEWRRACTKQQMKMIGNDGPGIALSLGLFEDNGQPIEEGFAVLVVFEDLSSFDPPGPSEIR